MFLSSADGAMSAESAPVFHESKDLTVTGVKIIRSGSVYPVSAVVLAEIVKRPTQRLFDALRILLVGVVLSAFVSPVLGLLGVLFGQGGLQWIMLLPGPLLILLGLMTVAESIIQRGLRVALSSGDSFVIWKMDTAAVRTMHDAVHKAMMHVVHRQTSPVSVADELTKLAALRDRGAISLVEWERARDVFLGKEPDAQQRAISQLQSLHELFSSGVLSESEFNMKKWDILAQSPGTY